jgi:hypothetical protein
LHTDTGYKRHSLTSLYHAYGFVRNPDGRKPLRKLQLNYYKLLEACYVVLYTVVPNFFDRLNIKEED